MKWNETISWFVADLLFERVCVRFIFLLCKNEDNPAALWCGGHTFEWDDVYLFLSEFMWSESYCFTDAQAFQWQDSLLTGNMVLHVQSFVIKMMQIMKERFRTWSLLPLCFENTCLAMQQRKSTERVWAQS